MAFKRSREADKGLQLVSLIDLIFILLIFFIITSVLIKLSLGESKLYIPTPKNEPGDAQILVQIISEDSLLWLDHTAIDTLNLYTYRLKRPVPAEIKRNILLDKMIVDRKGLIDKIGALKELAGTEREKDYFVIIRCPDHFPYHYATSIVERLLDVPNLEYGCVSGSIHDFNDKSGFKIAGNTLQIDFY